MSDLILSKVEYTSLYKHFQSALLNHARFLRNKCQTININRIYNYTFITQTLGFCHNIEKCARENFTSMLIGLKRLYKQGNIMNEVKTDLLISILEAPSKCFTTKHDPAHQKLLTILDYDFNKDIIEQDFEILFDNFDTLSISRDKNEVSQQTNCCIM